MTVSAGSQVGVLTLWAIGVGSGMGGVFFGWQLIMISDIVGAIMSVLIAAAFFWIFAGAITELAARYKSTGGSYDYVRMALGQRAGSMMAVLSLVKLVLSNAETCLTISSYLGQAGLPNHLKVICWILTYGGFALLDCMGMKQSSTIQVVATFMCVALVLFYIISSLFAFDITHFSIDRSSAVGFVHWLRAVPYAIQFFDGFEDIPLLMSYSSDPTRDIPQAITSVYSTICAISFLVLFAALGVSTSSELLHSVAPLMDGIEKVYGSTSLIAYVIAYSITMGLFINFFAFTVFTSQQVRAIAETGEIPKILAYQHPKTGAPIYATIIFSLIGVVVTALSAAMLSEDKAQDTLCVASLIPTIISYLLCLESIVKIRYAEKLSVGDDKKEFELVSGHTNLGDDPLTLRFNGGILGARIGQSLCAIFLLGLFISATYSREYMYGIFLTIVIITTVLTYIVQRNSNYTGAQGRLLGEYIKVDTEGVDLSEFTADMKSVDSSEDLYGVQALQKER